MESNNETTAKIDKEIVKNALKKGKKTVTILYGTAPTPPQTYANKPVNISGAIDAPSRFCAVREFDKTKSHALVSVYDGTIELVVNEQSTDDKFTVKGTIEIGKEYKELGINNPKIVYTPESLAKKLKLKRNMFETKIDHANLISQLRGVTAKVTQDVEQHKNDTGNKTQLFRQTVESNMPKEVVVCLPVIEGMEPKKIELNVILEAEDGKLSCTLESADGAELIEEFRKTAVKEQVDYLEDKTTVIYV